MERNSAWQARGVIQLDWTGGEAYSRGIDGHYWTNSIDWFNGWNYAYSTEGMAIDEAYCNAGFPTDPILQAIAMVRQAQPTNYSLNLWSDGFGPSFASGAALLKSNNVTVLVEDYDGVWNLHTSRWAAVRSPTRKEFAATAVLAVPLAEASVKVRTGPPVDDPADLDSGVWAGVVPAAVTFGEPQPDPAGRPGLPAPDHIRAVAARQAGGAAGGAAGCR